MAEAIQGISVVIDEPDNSVRVDPATGTVETDQPDGGVVVQLDAHRPRPDGEEDGWFANLADKIGAGELSKIANDLYEAIDADDRSRGNWLGIRARAMDFLGLEIKEPRANAADSSAAVEGLATVTNPLLLEACLKGWANAQAELLPSEGPCKIDDENAPVSENENELADALERDMNNWFTQVATEYYPDTSHMLLWGVYFGGSGFKKIYRCPMRRRPVSESVNPEDLIVSDAMKDLRSCERITHHIKMRTSVMKRMQLIGAYRKVGPLPEPMVQPTEVEAKKAAIQGTSPMPQRPEDQPYNIWETQCELDLPDFAPGKFRNEGIPLPYVVTLDKDAREILAIRRDWEEDDEDATRIRMYIKYPYVPGPGFYGTGMLNILGNASQAMTAAWRMALDTGMFASFPGGIADKSVTRQNTSDFRMAPGVFEPVETGGRDIRTLIMASPYRDVTPGLLALMDKITSQAQGLGSSADIPTAEGVVNVPVGTMLAQIEQATKVMAAAHKGMHTAQAEEIELIVLLFRKNPEDFFRKNKTCDRDFWSVEKFLQAINDCALVPRSDPNTPSHIHRIAKALGLVQMLNSPALAQVLSAKEVALRACRVIGEDPTNLVIDPVPQPPPGAQGKPIDPSIGQAKIMDAQTKAREVGLKAQQDDIENQIEREKLSTQQQIATAELAREFVIHRNDTLKDQEAAMRQHALDTRQQGLDARKDAMDHALGVAEHQLNVHQALNPPEPTGEKP